LDSKELYNLTYGGIDVKYFLNNLFQFASTFSELYIENYFKEFKGIDIETTDDEFSISLTFPKYENGISHIVRIPGINKTFYTKFRLSPIIFCYCYYIIIFGVIFNLVLNFNS